MRREFILAMSIFVTMAVVGTMFSLWFVTAYAPTVPPPTLDSRR